MFPKGRKILKQVKPYIPGKPIEEVKRQLGLKGQIIKLASNENPYPPSSKVQAAIARAAEMVNRYPASDCYYLRQQLAKDLKVSPSELIFGNGSDELIIQAVRAFVSPGEEVIMARPSFLIYGLASRIEGAKVKEVPLKELAYDLDGMKKTVTAKTRLIFLGNPDNPCGMYLRKKETDAFLKGLRKDILVFFDEAYFEYVEEKDYADTVALVKKYKNVVVSRTFSKIYGLAGLRIGYGVTNEKVASVFNKIREPFNVNSIAQAAALACLRDKGYYKKIVLDVKKQRKFLYDSLTAMNVPYHKTFTNFLLIKVNKKADVICSELMQKGIIIRNMKHWGLNDYIRVSIGLEKENKRFIREFKKIIQKG